MLGANVVLAVLITVVGVSAGLHLAGSLALEQFGQSGGLDFWAERTGAADPTEIFFRLVVYELSVFMISPFAHVHYSTPADPGPGVLLVLTLVAAAFTAAGLYGLRRRDLAM